MVGAERVVNAVSLNSVIVHSARIVGPALAGVVIAARRRRALLPAQRAVVRRDDRRAARGWRPPSCDAAPRAAREPGALRAALRYVRATPELAIPLALMAVVGTLSLQLPGAAAAAGALHLRRRRRHLRRAGRPRWASARSPARSRPARAARVRRGLLVGRRRPSARLWSPPRRRRCRWRSSRCPARRGHRDLRGRRQLVPAAAGRARACAAA